MAINRAALPQQLQAGAPDLRLTGDQTHRGTYTQRRRAQMSSGGISQLKKAQNLLNKNAPTGESLAFINPQEADLLKSAGGSGIMTASGVPSYLSLSDLNPIKAIKKVATKIKDDIIPNELKNPLVAATLANYAPVMLGGEDTLLQKGIGAITGTTPENNALDYLKNIFTGGGGGNTEDLTYGMPTGQGDYDIYGNKIPETGGGIDWGKALATILPGGDPGYVEGGLYNQIFGTGGEQQYDSKGNPIQRVNWQLPMAIGAGAGKLQQDYLDRQPKFPADQTSINFQTAAEAMADPNLRFKPKAQYADVAEGGRIGYDTGNKVINYNEDPEYRGWKKMYEMNPDVASMHDNHNTYLNFYNAQGQAQGGRIGYAGGGLLNILRRLMTPQAKRFKQFEFSGGNLSSDKDMLLDDILEEMSDEIYGKPYGNLNKKQQMKISDAANEELFNIQAAEGDAALDRFKEGWAQGGRIGADEGGLMNLGGMEKDYRQEGGFVPIGGKEKADDVPARLSKNEFVFTADAVRAAGGGDIDQGAEIMENLMENLEAGGRISEESQGLEGAREMFANTQQLEKRII